MALDSKNNIKSVFIVPDQAAITSGTITPGSVATGSVVVTNVSNEVLTSTTVVDYSTIKIVKDRGANLPLQQVRLNIADIIAYSGACYQPATEQVSYIGYNGSTGAIAGLTANTFYEVKLEHVPNAFAYGKRPANYKYGTWKSGVTAPTQADVAHNIQASLVQNFKPNRTIDWRVITEIICNNAGAAITGTVANFGVTRYSKTVTLDGTVTNVVAGDFIRLGGTTTAAPVYKVAAVNSPNTIVLEVAYQGVNATIAVANVEVVTAALAATAAFGIKITGLKQKYDVNRWRQYDKVRFNPFINEAFTTTSVLTTAAFDGVGVYEQAANDEYISWGDEGQIFVDQVPPLFREQDASPSGTYDVAILGWVNKLPSLIGAGENKGSAIFYIDDSCATQGEALLEILDAWVTNAYPTILKVYGCNGSTPGVIGACCEVECT
jgi:hypothetical protein